MPRASPRFTLFLSKHAELLKRQIFHKNESNYCDYLLNLLKAGCLLAEMVDENLVDGDEGWTVDGVNATLVIKYKGVVKIALEGMQVKAGESVMREIQEGIPAPYQNVELASMSRKARSASRKVNCDNRYSIYPNNS